MLDKVKDSLGIRTTSLADGELSDLIEAAKLDLGIAGVERVDEDDALILRAVITYCKMNFGATGDYGDFDKLKKSYDEQKSQLRTNNYYNERQ